jgi:serine/threonine-protein kinase
MLFQLLTGHLPFESDSMPELMQRIAGEPAPDVRVWRPELPEALADVVALTLQKRPEVRYAGAAQLADDLRAVEAMLGPAHTSEVGCAASPPA